jgi:hypothetical protein
MVLAFDNAGDFAKAVYGEPQHAGVNGAIAMTAPVPKMTGGNKSRRNRKDRNSRKNKSRRNQNGGKRNNRRNSRRNQNGGK